MLLRGIDTAKGGAAIGILSLIDQLRSAAQSAELQGPDPQVIERMGLIRVGEFQAQGCRQVRVDIGHIHQEIVVVQAVRVVQQGEAGAGRPAHLVRKRQEDLIRNRRRCGG